MSVLIKGMKMPEKCGSCDLFHVESPMHCTVVKGHKTVGAPYGMPRPDWCPLVEIPEHGRLIDADALIEFCAERWIPLNIDAVNMQPTIQPEKTQLSQEGTTFDMISRQAALDIFDDYNISVENGELEAYSRDRKRLCELQSVQSEERTKKRTETHACDLISRQAAIDALDCINGAEEVLRSLPSIQPEPHEGHWIEGKIYRDVIECYCSECGQLMTTAATVRMNYCPRCGADMRGEQHG